MTLYSACATTIYTGTIRVNSEIRTSSSERVRLLELGVTNLSTSASMYGFGRPLTRGVTPTTEVALLPMNTAGPASKVTIATAWSTLPTVDSQKSWGGHWMFYSYLLAIGGARILWETPRGLIIPASGSIVTMELQLGNVVSVHTVVDE